MKLRIKGNSVRLRLTQSEVAKFGESGYVKDELLISPLDDLKLIYALERSETLDEVKLSYQDQVVTVLVPDRIARQWSHSDQVGFEHEYKPDSDHSIFILVEKDFQCLHKRPNEDESDHYVNPMKHKA